MRRCNRPVWASIRSAICPLRCRSGSCAIPKDVVSKIGDPAYLSSIIPARAYEGQTADVETAAVVNFLVTRDNLSADTVYSMTKAIFTNLNQLVQTHPAARGISIGKPQPECRCRCIPEPNVTIARAGFSNEGMGAKSSAGAVTVRGETALDD